MILKFIVNHFEMLTVDRGINLYKLLAKMLDNRTLQWILRHCGTMTQRFCKIKNKQAENISRELFGSA